ncbi:chromosome segregation protein SMC [Enemella sp. A6]|uniref:chromosome segregation protein SMC n=1 Tax=Enemella sp. A6 TaxID=3440152 RepID=UPI003EB70688
MYLKRLTLRGFKSFASATTLDFEPGITCVVGPNGSGKSNVVDALSWVMGEQGAKSLRGGKMEDVIFAGTSGRAPLGRAEVVLTIDNSDGALPIEYSEVTIARTMFRNGGSEYAINGATARLLDVQELLSDSGIGREMHVIVGQGRLDSILQATPEDRRGFVEEAAGVLKHRKRKERALRKLESTEGNLQRLNDLLGEIRRQLKPLGRQAEVARKAAVIQAEARDARARLLADDLVQATLALESDLADEAARQAHREALEVRLNEARRTESDVEVDLAAVTPRLAAAQEHWYALAGLRERVASTSSIAAERVRHAAEAQAAEEGRRPGREPEDLEREAAEVRKVRDGLQAAVEEAEAGLASATEARIRAEQDHAAEDERVRKLLRAAADRREGLATLAGRVDAMRSRIAAADDEIERLNRAREAANTRQSEANTEFTSIESTVAGLDAGEEGLDDELERAEAALAGFDQKLTELRRAEAEAEREVATWQARADALAMGLERKDGAAEIANRGLSGIGAQLASQLQVESGWEAAIATALGQVADALVADDLTSAEQAFEVLAADDLGRAGFLISTATATTREQPALPTGARWATDTVTAPDPLRAAVDAALAGVVLVDRAAAVREVLDRHPEVKVVTATGELFTTWFAAGGSGAKPSLLEVQAAVDEAEQKREAAEHELQRLRFAAAEVDHEQQAATERVEAVLTQLHESDARMSAIAEQLGRLRSQATAAGEEAERLAQNLTAAEAARNADTETLAELSERLAAAEADAESSDAEPEADHRDELAAAARDARSAEMDARLALRTAEERLRGTEGRAEALDRAAATERKARADAARRKERRAREQAAAQAVRAGAQWLLGRVDIARERATRERAAAEAARAKADQVLAEARAEVRRVQQDLAEVQLADHRDELARTEQRVRLEGLAEKAREELGMEPDDLMSEFGPEQPVPVLTREDGSALTEDDEVPEPVAYVRAEQEKRLRSAEKSLGVLGRVNPLALEEYDAMQERHAFLSEQLADVQRTREDLLEIVADVDERVKVVFAEAYADVAEAFERVFARLFPGGEGRLVLTEPDAWLTTGIEVEARPAGKKVKRLSLLSGGERSLVAVAFLVALFIARPSPFYILDEVEAALDDTNLGRLLEIYEELRENSQLLVITHQKRTMEIADALYGVTMRGDGVSTVISQRIRD